MEFGGQLDARTALPGGKSPLYALDGKLGEPHDVEKRKLLTLAGLELRSLGRPSRSQSLYRLRYLGSNIKIDIKVIVLKGMD
jgi:hypothetical protein